MPPVPNLVNSPASGHSTDPTTSMSATDDTSNDKKPAPQQQGRSRWASGRVLTDAQRARKREVDRNARRAFKREYQQRVADLEEKVRQLSTAQVQVGPQSSSYPPLQASGPIPWETPSYAPTLQASASHGQQSPHPLPQQQLGQTLSYEPRVGDSIAPAAPPLHNHDLYNVAPTVTESELRSQTSPLRATSLTPSSNGFSIQDGATEVYDPNSADSNAIALPRAPSPVPLKVNGNDVTQLFNTLIRYIRSLNPSDICLDDAQNQDFVVRAVLLGWEHAMSRFQHRCPLWDVLHQVDNWLFKDCNLVERLSLMRILHRVYLYELTGWTGVPQNVPPWFKPRPVQRRFHHEPVVDHIGWPGLRERLVVEGTGILTNRFWESFAANFRFQWASEPLDAVAFNDTTGLYSISGQFHNSISNLANLRMDTPFFTQFPTLFDDFALEEQIPFPLTLQAQRDFQARRLNTLMIAPASQVPHEVQELEDGDAAASPLLPQYSTSRRQSSQVLRGGFQQGDSKQRPA